MALVCHVNILETLFFIF